MKILFRGKTLEGKWIFGGYVKCGNRDFIIDDIRPVGNEWVFKHTEVISETVGQFTGLLDYTGKKIFSGDIVKDVGTYLTHLIYVERGMETREEAESDRVYGETGVVKFCTEDVASCGCCYESFVGSGFKTNGVNLTQCEVLGNIHDNPELLAGGQDENI